MLFGTLQNAFYIVAIAFMGTLLLLVAVIASVALTVGAKIKSFEKNVKKKVNFFTSLPKNGRIFYEGFKRGWRR